MVLLSKNEVSVNQVSSGWIIVGSVYKVWRVVGSSVLYLPEQNIQTFAVLLSLNSIPTFIPHEFAAASMARVGKSLFSECEASSYLLW